MVVEKRRKSETEVIHIHCLPGGERCAYNSIKVAESIRRVGKLLVYFSLARDGAQSHRIACAPFDILLSPKKHAFSSSVFPEGQKEAAYIVVPDSFWKTPLWSCSCREQEDRGSKKEGFVLLGLHTGWREGTRAMQHPD
jgi:hypothetical protein